MDKSLKSWLKHPGLQGLFCLSFLLGGGCPAKEDISKDPAPPQVNKPSIVTTSKPRTSLSVQFHGAAKPLPADAVTSDWPHFLGPAHNATSTEIGLLKKWPPAGPKLVWEFNRGQSYAAPSVQDDRLVYIHRERNEEIVVCMQAETGKKFWEHRYPTHYRDRFGYGIGPRASPVIDGDRVYTFGVEGKLFCLELTTGGIIWQRDIMADFKLKQTFFGISTTPLIEGGLLIMNVGASGGPSVVALNKDTGELVWGAGDQWGSSYASPVSAMVHGRRRIFVFAGGESKPPVGGLLSIDPATGAIDWRVPWRSTSYESVNAANPVIFDNKVLVTASYDTGSCLVDITPELKHNVVWTSSDLACHWNTPIYREGYLYGFNGRHPNTAELICINAKTGKVVWRHDQTWQEKITINNRQVTKSLGWMRGSLLWADGQFLCLGEGGHLGWLDLSPDGYKELSRVWLFNAQQTWNVPVLSRGLLYVCQNTPDSINHKPARLLCYDLRASDEK